MVGSWSKYCWSCRDRFIQSTFINSSQVRLRFTTKNFSSSPGTRRGAIINCTPNSTCLCAHVGSRIVVQVCAVQRRRTFLCIDNSRRTRGKPGRSLIRAPPKINYKLGGGVVLAMEVPMVPPPFLQRKGKGGGVQVRLDHSRSGLQYYPKQEFNKVQ